MKATSTTWSTRSSPSERGSQSKPTSPSQSVEDGGPFVPVVRVSGQDDEGPTPVVNAWGLVARNHLGCMDCSLSSVSLPSVALLAPRGAPSLPLHSWSASRQSRLPREFRTGLAALPLGEYLDCALSHIQ